MAKKKRYTVKQVEAALRATAGIQSAAAAALGCSPSTVHNYVKRFKTLQKVIPEIKEEILDLAEGRLITQIKKGNMRAIIFYLRTQGRSRGYVTGINHEHAGSDGGPIRSEVTVSFTGLTDHELDILADGGEVTLADGTEFSSLEGQGAQ